MDGESMSNQRQSFDKTVKKNQQKSNVPRKKLIVLMGIVTLIIVGLAIEWSTIRFDFTHVSTDDAFISGSRAIVPVAPQVKGRVIRVFVKDNEYVKKGMPLFQIDSSDYIENVDKARSAFMAAKSVLKQINLSIDMQRKLLLETEYDLKAERALDSLNRKNYIRYLNLVRGNAVSRLAYDKMRTEYEMSDAKVKALQAALLSIKTYIRTLKAKLRTQEYLIKKLQAMYKLALINLNRTTIYAPCDGYVTKLNINVGSYVNPGVPYLSVVNLHRIWVVANFKETDIHKIKIGAPVIIKVDAYPNATFYGRVSSFQSGTGSVFSLLPPENATGNFIKVVQRVPVKIILDKNYYPNTPLYPGLSVEPYVLIEHKKG